MIVSDVRQPVAISGGPVCPVRAHHVTAPGSIPVQWSTALNTNPVTILTQNQTASGRLTEIEQAITQSLAVWTAESGPLLLPATLTPLTRTAQQNACGADGLNSICFDQMDMAFTPGVLAFTRVITADLIGIQVGNSAVSTELGPMLDADIYFSPGDPNTTFATPQALPLAPKSYHLESVLTLELGHFLGFSHSAVWSAMMFPYAPAPGTISATLVGWSCAAPGPAQFDGTYQIAALPVGNSCTVYAEALNGAASPLQFSDALTSLCRNAMTDAGWPPLQACIVPAVDISFTARTRPGP